MTSGRIVRFRGNGGAQARLPSAVPATPMRPAYANPSPPKVAIVHYWLVGMRGGERVLEALCDLFPEADIYTHVYNPSAISERIKAHKIQTTFIARLPGAIHHYQKYLPLMPLALEELDLSAYDLVISSEAGPAKGIITRPDALHVCYCHSPMRYAWDLYHTYRQSAGTFTKFFMSPVLHGMRQWDVSSAARVDHFIANSAFVASRIRKYYRRDADIVFPPVDVDTCQRGGPIGEHYLLVSELVPYKRVDLAVEAFSKMGKRLVVIGDGPEFRNLKKVAGPTIEFRGRVSDAEVRAAYACSRALIFPGEEDFGIVPVEAMASGRSVIAFGRGGALETIIDGISGVFFHEQTERALIEAVREFESKESDFDPDEIAHLAERFSTQVFKTQFSIRVESWLHSRGVETVN